MGTRRRLASATGWCALAFVLLTLALQGLSDATGGWQFVRKAYSAGAWWQLFSAQWVHLGYAHAAVNALAMLVLLFAFQGLVDGRLQCWALMGGYAGVGLVLVLDADCAFYAGASGALHGLLGGNATSLLLGRQTEAAGPGKRARLLGLAIGLGLITKLLVQHWVGDASASGWLGFQIYYPAHGAGASGGLLAVVLALALGARLRQLKPVGR